MRFSAAWIAFALALGCAAQTPLPGALFELDAAHAADACLPLDVRFPRLAECSVNEQCIAAFAPFAPSGTLFAVCDAGLCRAAERCVLGIEGGGSCTCGAQSPEDCSGDTPLCMRFEGELVAHCVAACP